MEHFLTQYSSQVEEEVISEDNSCPSFQKNFSVYSGVHCSVVARFCPHCLGIILYETQCLFTAAAVLLVTVSLYLSPEGKVTLSIQEPFGQSFGVGLTTLKRAI